MFESRKRFHPNAMQCHATHRTPYYKQGDFCDGRLNVIILIMTAFKMSCASASTSDEQHADKYEYGGERLCLKVEIILLLHCVRLSYIDCIVIGIEVLPGSSRALSFTRIVPR